ncbi:hypothetical protein VE00_10962 [Pseudogymnoascus sp. WSF 3629]|nr:hypothetical protein VE00_10962 [Pseudogymnoascus sp. WSF 3629]
MASSKSSGNIDPPVSYEPALTQAEIYHRHKLIDLRNRELDLEKAERKLRDQPWDDRASYCALGLVCLGVLTMIMLGAN